MRNLQRLPVLIRDKAGLNQEAVDQPEHHRKHNHSGSQHTCGGGSGRVTTYFTLRNLYYLFQPSQLTIITITVCVTVSGEVLMKVEH